MKQFLIFISGLIIGILATIVFAFLFNKSNQSEDGLVGLTIFPEKGDCIETNSRSKSSEIDIFQVVESNMALGNIKYYSDNELSGDVYRNYDIGNEVVVLLINYDDKTYYDD